VVAVMAATEDDDVVMHVQEGKMVTLYSRGARTSITCLRRNGQVPRTWGVWTGTTAKATDTARIGGSDTSARRVAH
jgi:hypothetical protein